MYYASNEYEAHFAAERGSAVRLPQMPFAAEEFVDILDAYRKAAKPNENTLRKLYILKEFAIVKAYTHSGNPSWIRIE